MPTPDLNMSTREAEKSDAAGIAKMQVDTWRTAYAGQLPQGMLDDLSIEGRADTWAEILSTDKTRTFVVEHDEEIVGFVNVGPTRDEDKDKTLTGEILAIYVDDEHQGFGSGSKLFAAAQDYFRDNNFSEYTLWVLESNKPTHIFYEKMGMAPDGAVKIEHNDEVELKEIRFIGRV